MLQHNIDCWQVYTSYDRDVSHVAYFSTMHLAETFKNSHKDRNYMGITQHKKNYVIFQNLDEVAEYSKERLRANALAKLTELEKEALGIKL